MDETAARRPVLLTGATGFVGGRLHPGLVEAGHRVRCASRDPERAAAKMPERDWVRLDVADATTLPAALQGCGAAVYLVHGMTGGGRDYGRVEAQGAAAFAEAAKAAGLRRIVYLGGVVPDSAPLSRHLESRRATGQVLRAGAVPCVELRASMIVGGGSSSWRIVRDLSARLPVMILPSWLESRSQPVAIDDVLVAIRHALEMPDEACGVYDVPGPETLSAREILERVARLRGTRPVTIAVPVVTPWLSSWWIHAVTRADRDLASELIEGLRTDLLARDEGIWKRMPEHRRLSFDEAARRALAEEERGLSTTARIVEELIRRVSPRAS